MGRLVKMQNEVIDIRKSNKEEHKVLCDLLDKVGIEIFPASRSFAETKPFYYLRYRYTSFSGQKDSIPTITSAQFIQKYSPVNLDSIYD